MAAACVSVPHPGPLHASNASDFDPTAPSDLHWCTGEDGSLLSSEHIAASSARARGKASPVYDPVWYDPCVRQFRSYLSDTICCTGPNQPRRMVFVTIDALTLLWLQNTIQSLGWQ
jgi:hypothetical protein